MCSSKSLRNTNRQQHLPCSTTLVENSSFTVRLEQLELWFPSGLGDEVEVDAVPSPPSVPTRGNLPHSRATSSEKHIRTRVMVQAVIFCSPPIRNSLYPSKPRAGFLAARGNCLTYDKTKNNADMAIIHQQSSSCPKLTDVFIAHGLIFSFLSAFPLHLWSPACRSVLQPGDYQRIHFYTLRRSKGWWGRWVFGLEFHCRYFPPNTWNEMEDTVVLTGHNQI